MAISLINKRKKGSFFWIFNLTWSGCIKESFWLTGILSAFLDNAPTYLVFFTSTGLTPEELMRSAGTLLAISSGAVFMGAMTYIGNAPNFMVRSIAEENKIEMPGFFGYMVWSILILVPIFLLYSFIWF